VPESVHLNRLLVRFQKDKIRIAIVVDEYGGARRRHPRRHPRGIHGDIYNELSKPRPIFQSAGPYAWLVDANISLEEINRKLRLDLQAQTSDRLAGWITEHLGSVPKQDDVVETQGVRVRVMQTIRLRVTLAHVEKIDAPRGGPAT
jgi:CBS domain containing-hemolysin-like protein